MPHEAHSAAGFWLRVKAFAWDYLVLAVYIVTISAAGQIIAALWPTVAARAFGSAISGQAWGFLLMTLPVTLYFGLMESSPRQATWGKTKTRLIVVGPHGVRLNRGRAIVRAALKFVPWELAHFTLWQSLIWQDGAIIGQADELTPTMAVTTSALWLLIAVNVLSLVLSPTRQTLYDRIAGAFVMKTA
jgi:uncharacterized RDD family membrane protein YckC